MEELEIYISTEEVCQWRKLQEYIRWFEEKLKITKEFREELKRQNLLHEGMAKYFYEELFPLYRLLQHKKQLWDNIQIKPLIDKQSNFDVEIQKSNFHKDIPQYIEITQTIFNNDTLQRMHYLINHGQVFTTGKIIKKGSNKNGFASVDVNNELQECSHAIVNEKSFIEKSIKTKSSRKRPHNTALLVYFDDSVIFAKEDRIQEMNRFLSDGKAIWRNQFTCFYGVGVSGKYFWEDLS
ncbi:MAG: hypothetical protein KKH94_06745 [Candidatus Omnitrophica bacterium]|nr:hypothetical protein [Candidatus Omnitrophota bacterium]